MKFKSMIALCCISFTVHSDVQFSIEKIDKNLHLLYGSGGNITISTGSDGIYIVDDQFAKLSTVIKDTISKLQPGSAEFVINTHYHGDHSGGNEQFALSGSHIIAHHNVHTRLQAQHGEGSSYLPVITFSDNMKLHFNGELATIWHYKNAHTDGDSVVYYKQANAVYMGDIYFNLGSLPFVDVQSGGSLTGMINAVKEVLDRIDYNTKVIPGHGKLSDKKELEAYLTLLIEAKKRMLVAMAGKKSLHQVLQLKPLTSLNLKYRDWLPESRVVKLFYLSLKKHP